LAQTPGSVELIGVTKRFGSVLAVDSLDLRVAAGEFLSLLGPSGCGKTTTLRMLAGFEQPDAGSIRLSGVDIAGTPPHRRDVNTVFQHYALFPHMTVAENVAYGLRQKRVPAGEIRERVGGVLEMVGMTEQAARRPKQLSGGQQQRVALARALVNRPALLLLDEPLGALDRKLRQEMQVELKLLQSRLGTTFIYVTHDQEEALSMSDRIAVMLDGRLQQLGTPAEIYDHPATAFVAGFVGLQNFLGGRTGADPREVRCAGVVVRARCGLPGLREGEAARVAIRPEHVTLARSAPEGAANAAHGRVASCAHLGEVMQYVVRIEGQDLLVRRGRWSGGEFQQGDEVWVSWDEADVHVFRG
jgi:spermidine/putrescine transport system ATP-binding protein